MHGISWFYSPHHWLPASVSPNPSGEVNNLGQEYPTLRISSQATESQYFRKHMGIVAQNMTGDDTHACLAMRRTAIRDVIPCERCALAQQAPVLF